MPACATFFCFVTQHVSEEPIHIVNIAIKYDASYTDEIFASKFEEFCVTHVSTRLL